MNKRPTIQTIAELAGVSRGTVDRVLNNRSYVRADVRARVLNAIQETGYLSPKEAHRQAAEAKLPLKPVRLGVLLPNWSGPFHEDVPRGIQAARSELEKRDVEVRVCTCETDIPRETIELLDELVNWGAQGIALCALNDISIEARIGELAGASSWQSFIHITVPHIKGHSVHHVQLGSAEQPPSVLCRSKLHTKRPYCRRAAQQVRAEKRACAGDGG